MFEADVHLFQQRGLGIAPYRFLAVDKSPDSCQYCGTGILYRFHLVSTDGQRFHVGSDCIEKSGDAGLIRVADAEVKRRRRERTAELKREKAAASQARQASSRRQQWLSGDDRRPGLIEAMKLQASANRFYSSLLDGFEKWGSLTDGQEQAAYRSMERIATPVTTSKHVGQIGERVEITITVDRVIDLEQYATESRPHYFSPRSMYLCRDQNGNKIIYKGASTTMPSTGDSGKYLVTVKKHDFYRDVAQTLIERPHPVRTQAAA